jgi:hypothetical protein
VKTNHKADKTPLREKMLRLLSDRKWHTYVELHEHGGFRYSARLLELKQEGYTFVDAPLPDGGKKYRLTGVPK